MSTTSEDRKKTSATRKRSTSRPSRVASTVADAPAKISAKEAAVQVLKRAHGPLHVKDIAERVLKMDGVTGLKGATPAATIAAMLSVENGKKDGLFKRVDKGTYDLRNRASNGGNGAGKPES